MPLVGLGTWQWTNQRAYSAVKTALKVGYRHVDTAVTYKNQAGIGRAIRDSAVPRQDIFITSKVPVSCCCVVFGWKRTLRFMSKGGLNFHDTTRAAYLALKQLNTSYVDLMLIHFPGDLEGMWVLYVRL